MSNLEIWLIYGGITGAFALLTYGLPDHSHGIVKALQTAASVLFVMIGITFLVLTAVLALEFFAPNVGSSGSTSDDSEQCVPDPWGAVDAVQFKQPKAVRSWKRGPNDCQ